MKRATLVICLAAILLLALAVPAFAAPDGSSDTVYGKAVLAPYAIVVSGGGTDPGNPLTYQGELNVGPWAEEMYGSQVSVQNVGTQDAQIKITADQLPTAGSNVWGLSSHIAGADVAGWCFEGPTSDAYVLQESDPAYNDWSVLAPNLAAGNSTWFDSYFHFPMATSSSADHYMSATISAAAPN
jgi:hypothetical protein